MLELRISNFWSYQAWEFMLMVLQWRLWSVWTGNAQNVIQASKTKKVTWKKKPCNISKAHWIVIVLVLGYSRVYYWQRLLCYVLESQCHTCCSVKLCNSLLARLIQCSSSVAAPQFYVVAYGLPINQGLVGADICMARCQHPLITGLLTICRPPHKTTVLPLMKSTVSSDL